MIANRQCSRLLATLALFSLLVLADQSKCACAIDIEITGYVSNLNGTPHTDPDITITVRSQRTGEIVASKKASPIDGTFSIPIEPENVPDADVRLSISASGTAVLNGRRAAVQTRSNMDGLAGEVVERFFGEDAPEKFTFGLIIVVPEKLSSPPCNNPCATKKCHQRKHCRFKCR